MMRWEVIGFGALVGAAGCARGTAAQAGRRAGHVVRIGPLLCAAVAGCLLCFVAVTTRGADPPVLWMDNEDVLDEATAQNSGMYMPPPESARHGSPVRSTARPNGAGKLAVQRISSNQLRVKLPAGGPVLAPAMADGRIFVGGGFNSTQFYCLDAGNGRTLWNVNLSDNGPSASSYYHGLLLFTTESCTCYALDAANGRLLWSVWLAGSVTSTPTIADGRVLVSYPAAAQLRGQPARRGGRTPAPLSAPASPPPGYVLSARDVRTGKPIWQKWIDHDVMSSPVVHGDGVYIVTFAGTLYKFRLDSGEILLARRCRATSAPVVLDDGVYLTRRVDAGRNMPQECLVKLNRRTGEQRYLAQRCWAPYLADPETRVRQAQAVLSSPPAEEASANETPPARKPLPGDPDYVSGNSPPPPDNRSPSMRLVGRDGPQALQAFCGSRLASFHGGLFNWMGGQLRAIDPATGAKQWGLVLEGLDAGKDAADPAAAPPAVANGSIFLATRSGQLLRIAPSSGRITGRVSLDAPAASQPVIDQGRVLVGTTTGELVCVNTGDPKLTGWNQWGGDAAHSGVAEAAAAADGADKLPRGSGRISRHAKLKDAAAFSPEPAPAAAELKAAYKAFVKRLRLAQAGNRSRSGGSAGIAAIVPPETFRQAVWDELVRSGKLKDAGDGKYELVQP